MRSLTLAPLCVLLVSDAPGGDPRPPRPVIPEVDLSYGALAQARLRPAVDLLADALARLNADILPHQAKDLRKTIAAARDLVDVFWFALATGAQDGPFWTEVRDELDDGYELVGAFKDVFDTQGLTIVDEDTPDDAVPGGSVREDDIEYRHSDGLQRRRHRVLRWATRFRGLLAELTRRVRGPLALPAQSAEGPAPRSRFYWQAAELRPSGDLAGYQNLRRLLAGLARASEADAAAVVDLSDPAKASEQQRFHDFRKQLRAIVRLADLFPELVRPSGAAVATLRRLVGDLGAIEDLVVAHGAAADREERQGMKKLRRKIDERWAELRTRQREMVVVLQDLAASVCAPSPPIIGRASPPPPSPRDPCLVRGAAPRP